MARKSTKKTSKISRNKSVKIDNSVEKPEVITDEKSVEKVEEKPEKKVSENSVKDRIIKNANVFTKEYFDKSACDYKKYGQWQKVYATMMHRLFNFDKKQILDVGGAYGALSFAFAQFNCKVTDLDISKAVIDAKLFKGIEYVLAPVQNMKKITDDSIDFVHVSHVFNYIDNKDMKRTLSEIKRVMKDGAKAIIIMEFDVDKENRFKYSEKEMKSVIKNVGLKDVTKDFETDIKKLPKSLNMFNQYKWDFFILEK